jgi:transcription factor SFP1
MAGTSPSAFPSAFQQPSSFQSSSYLPKMEASFFKDYWCCNICHASLHDLMQHMEECHGAQSANVLTPQPVAGQTGLSFPRQPSLSTAQPMHKAPTSGQSSQPSNAQVTKGFQTSGSQSKSMLATIHDDPLDSMDFDEPNGGLPQMGIPNPNMAQQPFRPQNAPVTSAGQPFSLLSSNPTVSSVNTPTLSTHTISQSKHTPDSSIPSTPHAANMTNFDTSLDMYNGLGDVQGMPLMDGFDFNNLNFGLPTDLGGLTIHDPAKQLSSKNGTLDNAQMQFAFNNGQYALNDEEINRVLNQQHFPGGIPSSALGFPGHEEKKYKCPVIGCEKAYKNQNGLKYHKQVSSESCRYFSRLLIFP